MGRKKNLPSKTEWLLILGALAVIAVFLLLRLAPGEHGTAHVTVRGEEVLTLSLAGGKDTLINLEEYGIPAALEVKDRKIRFVNVTCPDHICEKTGWVWKDGQSAVCMPNRAAVVITG